MEFYQFLFEKAISEKDYKSANRIKREFAKYLHNKKEKPML